MKITFICHSSFLVETDSVSLLFDYYGGVLPVIPKDRPLYILASHSHPDHYSGKIFPLAERYPSVQYLLSSDIPKREVPENIRERTFFLQPGSFWEDSCLQIRTLASNDQGIAFWCSAGETQIYHAGDLNNWYWDGDAEDAAMADLYHNELKKIAGKTADLAFIPLDPRLKKPSLGILDFMKTADARYIFPMHMWNHFELIPEIKKDPAAAAYRNRIMDITENGQIFSI